MVLAAGGALEAFREASAAWAARSVACTPPWPFSTPSCCPLHPRSRPRPRLETWAVVFSEPELAQRDSQRVGKPLAQVNAAEPCEVMRWALRCLAHQNQCHHRSSGMGMCRPETPSLGRPRDAPRGSR